MPSIRSCLFAVLGVIASLPVAAQDYPSRPITLIVSYSAGGNSDLRSRQLALPVGQLLGAKIVIDNKAGASGNIGHAAVARAAPDGYTLGMGAMGPLAVNPSFQPNMPFDAEADFTPVILIEKAPLVLVTQAAKPYRTLKDFIAAARARPGMLTMGNAGTGGAHHLSAEVLRLAGGIDVISVPYKGGGPASTALLAGEVDAMFEQTYAALPSIKSGRVRALAVTSDARLPSLPEVPTLAESGYAQGVISNWLGVVAPRNTPPAIVARLNAAFAKVLASPDMQEKIAGPGNQVGGGTPDQFGAFIAAERRRWAQLVKAANIRAE